MVLLEIGEPAPFAGVLSSARLAAEAHVRSDPERLRAHVDAAIRRERAEHELEREAMARAWDQERASLLARADHLADEAGQPSAYLPYVALVAIGLGILVGVGIETFRSGS